MYLDQAGSAPLKAEGRERLGIDDILDDLDIAEMAELPDVVEIA